MGGKKDTEGGQACLLWVAGPLSGMDRGAGGARRRRSSSLPMLARVAPWLGLEQEAWWLGRSQLCASQP